LVKDFDLIAVENLNVKGMAKSHFAKSIADASWSGFLQKLNAKAEGAAKLIVRVNARHTSQTCSACGAVKKKTLSERWHSCECGAELHRDHNAALNILARAGPARLRCES
jgi:putative transposase